MTIPRVTHTRTHVHAKAPCGHRLPVPNDAYDGAVELEACSPEPMTTGAALAMEVPTCGRRWVVVVTNGSDPQARFFRADAGPIAVATAVASERMASDFGLAPTVPPHHRIWEGIGVERQALALAVAAHLLDEGIIRAPDTAAAELAGAGHDEP